MLRITASDGARRTTLSLSSGADEDDDIEAWRLFLVAHAAAVRMIEQDVGRVGIPLTWYDVLLELNAATDGQLRMQELSDRVVLSRTRVSRLVDEMALHGLVRKRPDDHDRRSTWAVITPEGRTALHETAPVYMTGIREHFNQYLTKAEKRALVRALSKVVAAHSLAESVVRSN
ncbi:MAG: MarR family transcriptional regulator [Actinomycetota bacterium]|nr:MarR family transcriptional regulator [Actinomycetota bacterium]MDQ3574203.1 MarR family transcriptional regulator [Actinomycetota bacterium]